MAKVFLVDDDIDLIEQNKLVLTEKGYTVVTAHTAKEAIEKLKNVKPDVMVIDVMMEHPTAGFALAREIGANFSKIPVIILSGDTEKPNWMDQDGATWTSIARFLDKPTDPEKLAKVVKEVLKK